MGTDAVANASIENLKVVVVDDHRPSRLVVETILEALRVRNFTPFDNAKAAFDQICKAPPDLLITDLEMEPADGLDLIDWVRKGGRSPCAELPIVLVTGNMDEDIKHEALNKGVHEVLYKPVSVDSLGATITQIIESPPPFVKTGSYVGPDRRNDEAARDGPERRGS